MLMKKGFLLLCCLCCALWSLGQVPPAAPTVSGNTTICTGSGTTLTASSSQSGVNFVWSDINGIVLATTPSYTLPVQTTAGTVPLFVQSFLNGTNGYFTRVDVTVNPSPATFTVSAPASATAGSLVTLTASPATNTYSWTTSQGNYGSLTGASVNVVPTATTTYTATVSANGCSTSAAATVTLNSPVNISGNTAVCQGGTTTLTASGSTSYAWYGVAIGGTSLSTAAAFTTPALFSGKSYWVQGANGVRRKVNITVAPPYQGATVFPAAVCAGQSVNLKSFYTGKTAWYDAPTGGNLLGTTLGNALLAVTPAATKTYYAAPLPFLDTVIFNPGASTWTVPEGVYSIQVEALGSWSGRNPSSYGTGNENFRGTGGRVLATLSVTPGQILYINVGNSLSFNGGGYAYGVLNSYYGPYAVQGGNGGGATDIRIGGNALTDRVLVSGGAGGPGYFTGSTPTSGQGGGLTGQNGIYSSPAIPTGAGGTQSAGGNGYAGAGGSFGEGGAPTLYLSNAQGGGGGGGWYGGGSGGPYAGGGGGSSYTNPQYCSDVSHTQGYWASEGKLIITYGTTTCSAPATRTPVTVTVNPYPVASLTSNSACAGGALTVSATQTPGTTQWYNAGNAVLYNAATWNATSTTVAGGNGQGNALNQLNAPRRPFVTANGDVYVCDNSNHRVVKWGAGASTGVVVAGGNGPGNAANQLNSPQGLYVDDAGTMYIADENNHRIQKWLVGATTGTTVFGGNGSGPAANQLGNPYKITRDDTGNFYIVEATAHRVSKWAPGATSGMTVAGTPGSAGAGLSQLSSPYGLALDKTGAVYVADLGNGRIVKWAPGATAGTLVAGGSLAIGAQAFSPTDVTVDGFGNVYITDQFRGRVQRWAAGATAGTTVALTAGGNTGAVYGVALDGAGNLYVADASGNKVQKFSYNGAPLGYTPTVAGTYSAVVTTLAGCADTTNEKSLITAPSATIYGAASVCKDAAPATIMLTATGSESPYTFSYKINGGATQTAQSTTRKVRYIRLRQKGNGPFQVGDLEAIQAGTNANVALNKPVTSSGAVYPNQNYVNDGSIAYSSIWVASASGPSAYVEIDLGAGGYNLSEVRIYSSVYFNYSNDTSLELTWKDTAGAVLYTSAINAYRGINAQHSTVVPNPLPHYFAVPVATATTGTSTVTLLNVATPNGCAAAPAAGAANTATVVVNPAPVLTTATGSPCIGTPLHIVATPGAELRWISGNTLLQTDRPVWKQTATTIAGGNSAGSALNQLSSPRFGYAMPDGTFYASDIYNHRVVRWDVGATAGVVVAGGNGSGNAANQLNAPRGVYVDGSGNVYVADFGNHRVQKWTPGATSGITVAGTGSSGATAGQLSTPIDVVLDDSSYLYISDNGNHRVQKWVPGAASGTTVAGGFAGNGLSQLNGPYGIDVDDSGAVYVADLGNNRVVKWPRGAATGTQVAAGLASPTDVALDPMGNVYIADQFNNRILRYAPGATTGVNITGTGQVGVVHGVTLDATGNLYVTDVDNHRIRKFLLNDSISGNYTPAAAGALAVTATSFGGCTATLSKTIETPVTATISAPANACKDGAAQTVTFTGAGGTVPYTFAYTLNGGSVQTVALADTQKKVRYVRVKQNQSSNNLNLAEIQAIESGTGVNVALSKTATASSTLAGYPIGNINDGILTNFWHNNSGNNTEYVEIDLGAPGYTLASIKITNRGDCCQSRSANLQLILKDSAGAQLSSTGINAYQNQNNGYTAAFPVSLPNLSTGVAVPVTAAGAYKYQLTAVSTAGGCMAALTDTATVHIRPRATITTQPTPAVTLCSGTPLNLTAAAAAPATSYQWRKNGTFIAGANAATYNNPAFPLADSGKYSVIAIDSLYGCNDTSANSVVTTKLTPSFVMTGPALVCKDALAAVAFTSPGALYPTYIYTVNNGAAQTATPAYSKIRYIRVAQNVADFTNLAEIQAIDSATGTNVALGKTATASSGTASNINDGSTAAGNYWHSVSSNAGEWVEIDLGAPGYTLSSIKITNRGDCCQNRAANLQLTYKDNAGTLLGNETINAYQGQNSGYTASFVSKYNGYGIAVPTTNLGTTTVFKAISVATPNGCSSTSTDSFLVEVKQNAVITTEPDTAVSVCTSSPLTLSVVADSAASYQWRRNGMPIAGATAASYTKASAAAGDAGTYSVIAFNAGGCSDTSRTSVVTTKATPTGTISGNATVCAGAAAPLVLFSGTGSTAPYTFAYTVNGGAAQTTTATAPKVRYVKVMQADINNLYLAEVEVLERGTGINVARGKGGTSTRAYDNFSNITDGNFSYYNNGCWASVNSSDSEYVRIDLGPQGYDIDSIRIAGFDICCQDVLQYLYVSYEDVNGVAIVPPVWNYIDAYQGQNAQHLFTFPVDFYGTVLPKVSSLPVPTAPSGNYTYKIQSVTAANGCAFTPTDSVVVAVQAKAQITTQPDTASHVCEGSPLILAAVAGNASSFEWQKANTAISGATSATYTKPAAQASDAGEYRLIAFTSNGCNDTSTVAVVSTSTPPTATLTGGAAVCQFAPGPALTMTGTGGYFPYTFSYSTNGGAAQTNTTAFVCPKVRYIRVTQNIADWTNLAEIQVIDSATGTNIALNKPATASSGTAGNINDGSTAAGNYWHSGNSAAGEWVEIDLGSPGYPLSAIKITNRGDCCQNRAANLQLTLKDDAGIQLLSQNINAYQNQNSGYTSVFPVADIQPVVVAAPTGISGNFTYKLNSVTDRYGCASTANDSAVVVVNTQAVISAQSPATVQVCAPHPLILSAVAPGAVAYQWRKSGVDIAGATAASYTKTASTADSGNYAVIAVGVGGCNDTSTVSAVAISTLAAMPPAAAASATLLQADGMDISYTSAACEPIADITDLSGGNVLGMVNVAVAKDAMVQTFNGAPYLQRHFHIQPTNNGAATVKLYVTQAEFDAYNAYLTANSPATPRLPTGPTDTLGLVNLAITQFHGLPTDGNTGPGGQYNATNKEYIFNNAITKTWNGAYWTLSFPVSGFSGFFIHSSNGTPLPLTLTSVAANNLGTTNEVLWSTADEEDGTRFEVERSLDAVQFLKIGTVFGTGQDNTSYRLVDEKPVTGKNYYRVRAVAVSGESVLSRVVVATVQEGTFVVEAFPNPTRGAVTVRLSAAPGPEATLWIGDISGKLLRRMPVTKAASELSLDDLAAGLYFLHYEDGSRSQVLKITKE